MGKNVFHYRNLKEVKEELKNLNLELPLSENLSVLDAPIVIGGKKIANRVIIQPMEGCDGEEDGSPGPLTLRRYDRFAKSGAGLIWAEAVSVVPEGRANARQLMITKSNLSDYQRLVESVKKTTIAHFGFEPVLVMQATHSGRYSKPSGKAQPIIMENNPWLEKEIPLHSNAIASEEYLESLAEKYAAAAQLAAEAGFDGVDIKACHRYLVSESFSGYSREGKYGGSFENRTRLFKSLIRAAKDAVPSGVFLTTRMNIYDGFPYPYGFGTAPDKGTEPVLDEAIAIVKMLRDEFSIPLVNLTLGNPYFNPHVNRPFDIGPYDPAEHPFRGLSRASQCIAEVKKNVPDIAVVSSALSYLRQFSGNFAAGQIEDHTADLAGFGRQFFAYPSFLSDLLEKGEMDASKCCIACSKCSQLMRAGSTAGCVVRDPEYLPIYKRDVLGNERDIKNMISND